MNWEKAHWYRVVDPDGSLWAETSSKKDALNQMREGDTLFEMETRTETRWMRVPCPASRTEKK